MAQRKTTRRRSTARRTTRRRTTRRPASRARSRTTARRAAPKRRAAARRRTVSQPKSSRSEKESFNKALAIIGLLVNVLLFPGLGTIIAGKTRTGVWQIVLLGIGVILSVVLIGIPIIVAAWIWALISSIQILQNKL